MRGLSCSRRRQMRGRSRAQSALPTHELVIRARQFLNGGLAAARVARCYASAPRHAKHDLSITEASNVLLLAQSHARSSRSSARSSIRLRTTYLRKRCASSPTGMLPCALRPSAGSQSLTLMAQHDCLVSLVAGHRLRSLRRPAKLRCALCRLRLVCLRRSWGTCFAVSCATSMG